MSDDKLDPAAMDAIIASIRDGMTGPSTPPAETAEPVATAPPPITVPPPETTLEALVRTALEPVLKAWLDANLPEIVDRAAREEITRLTRA